MLVSWFGLPLPLLNAADWSRRIRLVKRLLVSSHVSEVIYVYDCCWFFFSSRRRHTRCSRDWSSDVCSSDLGDRGAFLPRLGTPHVRQWRVSLLWSGFLILQFRRGDSLRDQGIQLDGHSI